MPHTGGGTIVGAAATAGDGGDGDDDGEGMDVDEEAGPSLGAGVCAIIGGGGA